MVVSKNDLINMVAEKTGLTKKDAGAAVAATIDAVTESLVKGDKVSVIGFGSLSVKTREAREARNPRTGEKFSVPSKKVVAWKMGAGLSEKVNG